MDQNNLEIQYKNDQHRIDFNQEHYLEEQRKQNENINRQRDDLRHYLEYDDSFQTLSGISRMKNGEQLLKTRGVSLLSMKTATERIYHKDKKDYTARSTAAKRAIKQAYRTEHAETLSDSKADLAYEYRQLLENCRVFDNEVRETVEETLAQHPDLLAEYENGDLQKRTEALSRLVTAFLPEREFHFNPPSGDQKSLVKKYLKDFKSNPVNAIRKMQQSLRGERMHRDLMDTSSGMKNFRMLYTDMRKRESLAAVFPHISKNAAENFEVRKMNEGVEARKTMITNLFLMNGMTFDWNKDLEFNGEWQNTKTLAGQTKAQKKAKRQGQSRSGYTLSDSELAVKSTDKTKEDALTAYIDAYYAVRNKEKEINKYYKDQITAGITEGGLQYQANVIHKNYRAVQRFAQDKQREKMFIETKEECRIPFSTQRQNPGTVQVHTEKYHAYQYLLAHLRSSISDANYTRHRRERLKKMKGTPSLPASILEKNRQKEEARLRLLENRITDFQTLMRLMEDGDFNPEAIEDQRLKKLYSHEIAPEAKNLRNREAMNLYDQACKKTIMTVDQQFREGHYNKLYNDQVNNPGELSIPKSVLEEFDAKERRLKSARLFVANKQRYDEELAARREEWKKEDKRNEAKKIGRALLNLSDLEQDDLTKEERLEKDIVELSNPYRLKKEGEGTSPKVLVEAAVDTQREKLFERVTKNWEEMDTQKKKEYYFKLLGRKAPEEEELDENGFCEEDVWELSKEEEDLLVQYFDGETYWKIRENFDEEGNLIRAGKAPVFTEEDKKSPEYEKVQDLFTKMRAKMKFDENRAYPPEIVQYFEKHHDNREGCMDFRGKLSGRVKFNVERVVGNAKNFLKIKEEEIQREKERLKKMQEKEKEQRETISQQAGVIGKFAEDFETTLAAYEKKAKKSEKIEPGKLITVADLLRIEELKNYQAKYLENNVEFMFDTVQGEVKKNLEQAGKLEERLRAAFKKQYTVVIKDTGADLKQLDQLIKDGDLGQAELFSKNLSTKLDSLLFKDSKYKTIDRDMEQKLKDLKNEVWKVQSLINEEISANRSERLKEIDELYAGLTKEPEKELAEKDRLIGVTKEIRTLRKVSLLAQKCAAYLENESKKDKKYYNPKLFKRKEDADRINNLMTELKKNYFGALEEKFLGKHFKEVVQNRTATIQHHRQWGNPEDPNMIEPDVRYHVKYARGYLAMAGFGVKKVTEEQERKHNKVESLLNYFNKYVFLGEVTGLESEEEEEQKLSGLRANYDKVVERKARQEKRAEQEFQKQQLQEMLNKNDNLAYDFIMYSDVGSRASELRARGEKEKEALSVYEKESQEFLKNLSTLKKEYAETDKQMRKELENYNFFHSVYNGKVDHKDYKAGDPETLKLMKQHGENVRNLYIRKRELSHAPEKMIMRMKDQHDTVLTERNARKDILQGIVEKKPEFFETDPEKRLATTSETINELCKTRQILEYDQLDKVLEVKRKRDEGEALSYFLETKGAIQLEFFESCLRRAKKGDMKADEGLRDTIDKFTNELKQFAGSLTEEEFDSKADPVIGKMKKMFAEIRVELIEHNKTASINSMMDKINKLPDDLVLNEDTMAKIREILNEKEKQLTSITEDLRRSRGGDEETFEPLQKYVNSSYDSPEMTALKKKIEKPIQNRVKELTGKVSLTLQNIKDLSGDERTEKIRELQELSAEMTFLDRDLQQFADKVSFQEDRGLLWDASKELEQVLHLDVKRKERQEKTGKMNEDEILGLLDDLEEQANYGKYDEADLKQLEQIKKTFEALKKKKKDLLSDPDTKKDVEKFEKKLKTVTEKARQDIDAENTRKNYRLLAEEISTVISKQETLTDSDLKMIQRLMSSLNGYAKNQVYQKLLKDGIQEATLIRDAIERDKARLEKRLALHKSDAAAAAKFAEMQKQWASASKKKVKGGDYEKVKKLDAQIVNYQKFLESKEVLDLRAEKIGTVSKQVNAAIKAISDEAARIRCKLLDQTFAGIRKEADKVIEKKGALNEKDMQVLAKALEDLNLLSVGETYKKLEEVLPNEGAIRLQTWDQYIEKVTNRFKQVA